MKKILYFLSILIILTIFITFYVHANYDNNIIELSLSEYIPPKNIKNVIEKTSVYDYVIVYDLFSNEKNEKIYFGNINILIHDNIKNNYNLELDENEVIIGNDFANKHYAYSPIGEKHITEFGEYKINGLIPNDRNIYYGDLSILDKSNIKNQRLYIVLKSENNNIVDENIFMSQIKGSGISISTVLCYKTVTRFLIKILILLVLALLICFFIKSYLIINKYIHELLKNSISTKYDVYFNKFILQKHNFKKIIKILLLIVFTIFIIIIFMFLTVKFLNLRMPYKLNPVSPKSYYELISLFINNMSYYIKNGMTKISMTILLIINLYFIIILIFLLYIIKEKRRYFIK